MKLINFKIENAINLGAAPITLQIENPSFFAYTVSELARQIDGVDGDFLLYKSDKEVKISTNVAIIIDPIGLSFNDRKIVNKLYTTLREVANNEMNYLATKEIMSKLSSYVAGLSAALDYGLDYSETVDLTGIFKLFDVKPKESYNNLIEKLIDYINVLSRFKLAELLILVNIKSYLSYDDLKELYKHCRYNDFSLLMIESKSDNNIDPAEEILIIDKDLCEILVCRKEK